MKTGQGDVMRIFRDIFWPFPVFELFVLSLDLFFVFSSLSFFLFSFFFSSLFYGGFFSSQA